MKIQIYLNGQCFKKFSLLLSTFSEGTFAFKIIHPQSL